jgi:hypothetical protein
VFTRDMFQYFDEPYDDGHYATAEEAVARATELMERNLHEMYKSGMTAKDLRDQFTCFGEAPMVFGPGTDDHRLFDAMAYADKRCPEIARAMAMH